MSYEAQTRRKNTLAFAVVFAGVATFFQTNSVFADEAVYIPGPERSAPILPPPRFVAASLSAHGAYIPKVKNLSSGRTGAFGGRLTWNFAFTEKLGLFGEHGSTVYRWSDVGLMTFGHEVGVRFLPIPQTGIELAYLTHRADHQWIEDNHLALGGVSDQGVELAAGQDLSILEGLTIRLGLRGRYFFGPRDHDGSHGYAAQQLVAGAVAGALIRPLPGHELLVSAEALVVKRFEPREGVEAVTVNLLGLLRWRSHFTEFLGLEAGARVSTNLLVGAEPMLELKRSMIGEPMGMGFLGLFAVL